MIIYFSGFIYIFKVERAILLIMFDKHRDKKMFHGEHVIKWMFSRILFLKNRIYCPNKVICLYFGNFHRYLTGLSVFHWYFLCFLQFENCYLGSRNTSYCL